MIPASKKAHIRPVHPFPARMAPSIVWDALPNTGKSLNILDPMSGSGTTLVCARSRGHNAIGCDTDPLALLIARAWCSDMDPERLKYRAEVVLERAENLVGRLTPRKSYPVNTDDETRKFIDFWFDPKNRRELTALAKCISRVRSKNEKTLLWCAFSRMIITKTIGVSLGMDISHSRPHKAYEVAPMKPFDAFIKATSLVARNCPFQSNGKSTPLADIQHGDARDLPIKSASVDMVITSPPYLNAIDYLRGHKLSLIWMGHTISEIRLLRSGNIGAEVSKLSNSDKIIPRIIKTMGNLKQLDKRHLGIVRRYICDMNKVMEECVRVLKLGGRAIFVIGNSAIRGVFVKNSAALRELADLNGFSFVSDKTREIESNRRYLPPPESKISGKNMRTRMREEVILEFCVD